MKTQTARKPVSDLPEAANDNHAPVLPVIAFDRGSALDAFRAATARWHTAALAMIAAGSVVFFVEIAGGQTPVEVREALERAVRERGLKRAQAYRYLGLAQTLFVHRTKVHPETRPAAGCFPLPMPNAPLRSC